MTVIKICLGKPEDASTDLLKLLDVLFSEEHSAEEKKQILVNEFDIKMTKTLEGGVEQVINGRKLSGVRRFYRSCHYAVNDQV